MNEAWQKIAQRVVRGLQVQPGEFIQVRSLMDRLDVLQELLLAVELAGATPLAEILPPAYLERLMAGASPDYLANWDKHRTGLMEKFDRILVLEGEYPNFAGMPADALKNWRGASHRVGEVEESRKLPFLLMAVPTAARAAGLGISLEELEEKTLAALAASPEELQAQIQKVLGKAEGGTVMTVNSGPNGQYELRLKLGNNRPWLSDDGLIDAADRERGAIVSNLPAGSIYTTVLEGETEGSIWLPVVQQVKDVVLHFQLGRVIKVEAGEDTAHIDRWLDSHSGEPRRVSHIGIGLNPFLKEVLNWTLVDEHLYGYLFLALGENRYMGGQNESSLNVDYTVPGITLKVDGRTIVEDGKVV